MKVFEVENVHVMLPIAIDEILSNGVKRPSRNGPVYQSVTPVATIYRNPCQRIVHWPVRDYNIAFCLYEALWMLAGRNDLAPLLRYVKSFADYSDDGRTLHGAYGHRWRRCFGITRQWTSGIGEYTEFDATDQLGKIIKRLSKDPTDRRCVLQMWDTVFDLDSPSKDVPCNTTATFQISHEGKLDMVVFCRSNDIIFGAYFANAFHFSFLLEYMALMIGVPVGTYTQISVNWHAYEKTIEPFRSLVNERMAWKGQIYNPYLKDVIAQPLEWDADQFGRWLLAAADGGFKDKVHFPQHGFWNSAYRVLRAHHIVTSSQDPDRFLDAMEVLVRDNLEAHLKVDMIESMGAWVLARAIRAKEKA
jgi:thymidylate synthase